MSDVDASGDVVVERTDLPLPAAGVSALREVLDAASDLRSRARRLRMVADRLDDDASVLEGDANSNGSQVVKGPQAIKCLGELVRPGVENHYTDLERLLAAAGYRLVGINPTNTLISALGRSREFKSVGSRTGLYRRVS